MPLEIYQLPLTNDISVIQRELNRILYLISLRLNHIQVDGENVSLGSKKITELAAGTDASDAVRKDQSFNLADLADVILGTENQITVTDNGDETITLSTPQDLDTSADLIVDTLTLDGNITLDGTTAAGQLDLTPPADTDITLHFDGTTNQGDWKYLEDEDRFDSSSVIRTTTSLYRRYYHLNIASFDPGAAGATWVSPSANTVGGWNLTAATDTLEFGTDVHADWDGASDLTVEIYFAVNADNTGGNANDTVDLRLRCYYNAVGETATKTQTVEVPITIGACAQYTVFKCEFTIDWDSGGNVVESSDIIGFILNLETDTSEVDDIIILQGGASYYYQTTHTGIEAADV